MARGADDQAKRLKLRNLAADRRVIPSNQVSQLDDGQRAARPQPNKKWKQRTVECDIRPAQQEVVALGTIQEADQIDQRASQNVVIARREPAPFWVERSGHFTSALVSAMFPCMIHVIETRATPSVLVIMGSTRKGRICPKVAAWVADIGRAMIGSPFEIVDPRDWSLPMDDEAGVPAAGVYETPHTRKWSEKIATSCAVIFVTPQYNWGYPAALKNGMRSTISTRSGATSLQ